MSVAEEFVHALSGLDWRRAQALVCADVAVVVTGAWAYGGASAGLHCLRHATEVGAPGWPPLRLDGRVRRILAQGDRVAAEISGAPDYAMMLSLREGEITRVRLYFDTYAYRNDPRS